MDGLVDTWREGGTREGGGREEGWIHDGDAVQYITD